LRASSTPTGTSDGRNVRQAREQIVHLGLAHPLLSRAQLVRPLRPATSAFFASASTRFPARIRAPISLLAALRKLVDAVRLANYTAALGVEFDEAVKRVCRKVAVRVCLSARGRGCL
jgi:hypothetical protein